MYLNQAIIIGNITKKPEMKELPNSGTKVCNFSVATNKVWFDNDGQKKEAVEYHNIVAFSKTAENIFKFMDKGSKIMVIGELQTQSWEKDGVKKYRTEIKANTVQFGPRLQQSEAKAESTGTVDTDDAEYPDVDINPDDIPF
jgi:single-strand DNA-binding protein